MQRDQSSRREAILFLGATSLQLASCSDDAAGSVDNSAGAASGGQASAGASGGGRAGGANGVSGGGATAAEGGGAAGAGGSADGGTPSSAGAAGDAGASADPECVAKPAQTLGPFPNKANLNRSDIRAGRAGAALRLRLRVSTVFGCIPVSGAIVELWQCDALGNYSEYSNFGTADQNWLRGFQLTDASGSVEFLTIYPGWYPGRSVHLHFRIRREGRADFASQLYFDDELSDVVLAQAPYTGHTGKRPRNVDDGIFSAGGSELLLSIEPAGGELLATFDIGLPA